MLPCRVNSFFCPLYRVHKQCYRRRYSWLNNLINLRMHKTSSYFLQHFDPEWSSSGNTRLETCYTKQTINIVYKQCLRQTHTTALHSSFTNCPPNTRVLTSHGSWIEIANKIQAFFIAVLEAALKCQSVSPFPQLPEMHPFSDINTD